MWRTGVLLGLLVLTLAVDYCEVPKDSAKIFIQKEEMNLLNLNSYVRGYDLSFEADNPIATIHSSYEISVNKNMGFKEYNTLKSVDVKTYDSLVGLGKLALLAQKENNKDIAVWVGNFEGYEYLPDFSTFRKFTLPSNLAANCFDLRSINANGDSILNCQTIPKTEAEDPNDLLCLISQDDKDLNLGVNCNLMSSLQTSLSRRSRVLTLDKRTYLLSENRDMGSLDYITIYYLNEQRQFVFANIIDGSSLPNPSLDIADYVITNKNEIIVADTTQSRLIYFSYSSSNEVKVTNEIALNTSKPLAITYTANHNTLFVATREGITEYDASNISNIVSKYEVDPADNLISGIQVSDKIVAFTTNNKNLFLYERGEHKINYLLDKVAFPSGSTLVVSQQVSYLYTFNIATAQAVSVSQPYVSLSGVTSNQTVTITATSYHNKCVVKLDVKFVEDNTGIVNKENIQEGSFMVDPTQGISLKLNDFYGGVNLQYNLPEKTTKNFTVGIKQVESFDFKPSFASPEKSTVLAINSDSFYYIGVNSVKENKVYADLCQRKDVGISCSLFWNATVPFNLSGTPVDLLETRMRSNGDPFVIWSYRYSSLVAWVNLKKKGIGMLLNSTFTSLPVSSFKLTDQFSIIVWKTTRIIEIFWQTNPSTTIIGQWKFSQEQLISMEQFYPREVILDKSNPRSFFVKFPSKIARFVILDDRSVRFVGIVRDYQTFILDSEWTFTYTGRNILTVRDKELKEEYYNPSTQKFVSLQKIPFDTPSFSEIRYDEKSKFATVNKGSGKNQTVKVLVPQTGSMDTEYVQMKLMSEPKVSQNWVLDASGTPKIYYVNSAPVLSVQSNLPDDIYKEDVTVDILIATSTKNETSKAMMEGFNSPVAIKDIPNVTVIKLPASSENKEIKLDVDKFFTGPIAEYALDCPFCRDGKIALKTSFGFEQTINEVTAAVDYVTIGDRIIALTNNRLILMNSQSQVVTISPIPAPYINCNHMAYDQYIGLLIYCTSSQTKSGQVILQYSVNKDKFYLDNTYEIESDHVISQFDQMFAFYENADRSYIFILDNDETIDSNNKHSTIKVFQLGTKQLKFLTEWDSKTFGTNTIYPINDFQVYQHIIFVTIGNYGIGYANFNSGILTSSNNIQLSKIPDVKDISLASSFFKQIEILDYNAQADQITVFISSTKSFSMVVKFSIAGSDFIFKAVTQTYFRYGTQRLLNWHTITKDNVYLSYYNETSQYVTIVCYNRKNSKRNQFIEGVTVKLSKNMVKYHEAYLTSNRKLLVSHLTDVPQSGSLMVYNIQSGYSLVLNYKESADFNKIDLYASNSYHTIAHTQKIEFDSPSPPPPPPPPPGPEDGVKWYVIVIVVAVVLVAVGAAYGIFRYMKKKRAEKNVSLLTEKEQEEADGDTNEKAEKVEADGDKNKRAEKVEDTPLNDVIQE